MKYVLVIEDDARFQREIAESLAKIDPKLNVRFFSSLPHFSEFVQKLIQNGPSGIHGVGFEVKPQDLAIEVDMSGEPELSLLICNEDLLGKGRMDLLKKTLELFLRKNLCTAEAPTGVVITAFEKEESPIKSYEFPFVNNVIMKPFDGLILQEHLTTALLGRRPVKASLVHRMKTRVEVEMIKDVEVESFSDIGFVTRSPREVRAGMVAKYYGELFDGTKRNFVHARCWKSEDHPQIPGQKRCWFTFFGTESQSHSEYRRKLNQLKPSDWREALASQKKNSQAALISSNEAPRRELKEKISSYAQALSWKEFNTWSDFHSFVDPISFEGQQKEQSWSGEQSLTVFFEASGKKILSTEPLLEGKPLFGYNFSELTQMDFLKLLDEVSLKTWMKLIVQKKIPMGPDPLFLVAGKEGKHLIKAISFSEEVGGDGVHHFKLIFSKADMNDKLDYYSEQETLKDPLGLVIIDQVIVQSVAKEVWDNFQEVYKKKFGQDIQWVILTESQIEETKLRETRSGVLDIHQSGVDFLLLARKINFFLGQNFDENFKFFASNSPLSVANPIEIHELSESGLVMKYYRPISPGSFRKFVLPKASGGKVLEYLAACNYSEPDSSDKTTQLNYFVFFGITDAFLKNIRIWIRENYAAEKEKAAS